MGILDTYLQNSKAGAGKPVSASMQKDKKKDEGILGKYISAAKQKGSQNTGETAPSGRASTAAENAKNTLSQLFREKAVQAYSRAGSGQSPTASRSPLYTRGPSATEETKPKTISELYRAQAAQGYSRPAGGPTPTYTPGAAYAQPETEDPIDAAIRRQKEIAEQYARAEREYKAAQADMQMMAMSGGMVSADAAAREQAAREAYLQAKKENDRALRDTDEGRAVQDYRQAMAEMQMAAQSGGLVSAEQAGREREAEAALREMGIAADQRAGNIVKGAAKRIGAGYSNALATGIDATALLEGTRNAYDPLYSPLTGGDREKYRQEFREETHETVKPVYEAADRWSAGAAADLEKAKQGLGALGQAGVDIAENMLEMGFDAVVGSVTGAAGLPGGSLGSMFIRVLGNAEQEARQSGATLEQQLAYGLSSAGIEFLTEKISGVATGIFYGKGAADDFTEMLIGKLAQTDTGRSALRLLMGAVSEGGEEVLSDLLSPLAEAMYKTDEQGNRLSVGQLYGQRFSADGLAEMAYDFLIGAAVGALSGGGSILTGADARANRELREQQNNEPGKRNAQPEGRASLQTEGGDDIINGTLRRAAEMQREGRSPSEIYNETGLFTLNNGRFRDGRTGEIYDAGAVLNDQGGNAANNPGGLQREQRAGGEIGGRGENNQRQLRPARGWSELNEQERATAREAINKYADNSPGGEMSALMAAFTESGLDGQEEIAKRIYEDLRVSPVIAENRWGNFFSDINGLLEEMSKGGKTNAEQAGEQSIDAAPENGDDGLRTVGEGGQPGPVEGTQPGGEGEVREGVQEGSGENLRSVTLRELGVANAAEGSTINVQNENSLTGDAAAAAQQVRQIGMEPVAYQGDMIVNGQSVNGYIENGKIFFRTDAKYRDGTAISPEAIVRHEAVHQAKNADPEIITTGMEIVRQSRTEAEMERMMDAYRETYQDLYDFENMSEKDITDRLVEEIVADAYAGLNYFRKGGETVEKIRNAIGNQVESQTAETGQESTGPTEGKEIRFSAKLVENLNDDDVYNLLQNRWDMAGRTYFPVRKDTPQILIKVASEKDGVTIPDNPIACEVKHMRWVMEEGEGQPNERYHAHELTEDDVLEILHGMDNPEYLVWQDEYGRYAFIVRYFNGKETKNALVSLDLNEDMDADILNGYEGRAYNIAVTLFNHKNLDAYLKDENHHIKYSKATDSEYYKKEGALRSGSNRKRSSHSNSTPSADSILDSSGKSNPQNEGRASAEVPGGETVQQEFDRLRAELEEEGHDAEYYQSRGRRLNELMEQGAKAGKEETTPPSAAPTAPLTQGSQAKERGPVGEDGIRTVEAKDAEAELAEAGKARIKNDAGTFLLTVRQKGDGKYLARVDHDGKLGTSRSFETAEEAAAYAQSWVEGVTRGTEEAELDLEKSEPKEPQNALEQLLDPEAYQKEARRQKENKAAQTDTGTLKEQIKRYEETLRGLKNLERTPGTGLTEEQRKKKTNIEESLRTLEAELKSREDGVKKKKEQKKADAERKNKPTQSKRDAKKEIMYLFNVAKEDRPGLYQEIGNRLDELWNNGRITEKSRSGLMDMLVDYGATGMEVNDIDENIRRVDQALRKFAEKANLEVDLKDLSASRLAEERARWEHRMKRRAEEREATVVKDKLLKRLQRLERAKNKAGPELKAEIEDALKDIDTMAKRLTIGDIENLQSLQDAYNQFKESKGYVDKDHPGNFIPKPALEKKLESLTKRHISDMSLDEVIQLGQTIAELENEYKTQGKIIGDAQEKTVEEYANGVRGEVDAARGAKPGSFQKWFMEEHLSPRRFLEMLGGWKQDGYTQKLSRSLEDGQTRMLDFQRRATQSFDPFLTKKENRKWLEKASGKKAVWEKYTVVDGVNEDGASFTEIELTPMMKISLYLHSRNMDNLRHIQTGGIVIPNKKLYKAGKIAEAYELGDRVKMNPETVRSIAGKLTAIEKTFANHMIRVFDTISKDAINEVSMQLDGFERAGVENYMPIETDRNFIKSDVAGEARAQTVEGIGSIANERIHASNPVMLIDASDVLTRQIDKVSRYYGYAIPIRNFQAVNNYVFHEEGAPFSTSVKELMGKKWGAGAEQYITKMLQDLQGGVKSNSGPLSRGLDRLRGNLAGSNLSINVGVAIPQFASYPGAAQAVGWDGLAAGMIGGKVDTKLIEKYTPLYWYRAQGYSNQELGDAMTERKQDLPQKILSQKWLNWIQGMDLLTVRRMWKAAEYRVSKDTGLKPGSQADIDAGKDAYYKAVAEVFNRAVYDTQPNYTMMERPQILRSGDSLTRMLTMFKTVPLQYYGMTVEAVGRLQAAVKSGDKAQIAKAQKYAINTIAGILMANSFYATMKALWKIYRKKDDDYRDEEGNLTFGSVSKQLALDMVEVYAGSIIGGAEMFAMARGLKTGQWHAPEISPLAMLEDLYKDIRSMYGAIDEGETRKVAGAAKRTALDLSACFGIPARNAETLVVSSIRWCGQTGRNAVMEYDNLFGGIQKSDLKSMDGDAVSMAAGLILSNRTGVDLGKAVSDELARLYGAGETAAVPTSMPDSFTYNGTTVTIKDRTMYGETWGGVVSDNLEELIGSDHYQGASDKDKAKMVNRLYEYATVQARKGADPAYSADGNSTYGWTVKAEEAVAAGIPLPETICALNAFAGMTADKDEDGNSISGSKKAKVCDYIDELDLTVEQKDILYLMSGYKENSLPYTPWHGWTEDGSGASSRKGKSSGKWSGSRGGGRSRSRSGGRSSGNGAGPTVKLPGSGTAKTPSVKSTGGTGSGTTAGKTAGKVAGSGNRPAVSQGRGTGKAGSTKTTSRGIDARYLMGWKPESQSAAVRKGGDATANIAEIVEKYYDGNPLLALADGGRKIKGRTTVDFEL